MKKSFWPTIVVFLLFLGCATSGEVKEAKILKYGIYTATFDKLETTKDTVAGKKRLLSEVEFIDNTTQIPAILGTRFGFRYTIKGSPEGKEIRITVKRTHPTMKNPKTGKVMTMSKYTRKSKIGHAHLIGYGFDEEWELVPGDHIF